MRGAILRSLCAAACLVIALSCGSADAYLAGSGTGRASAAVGMLAAPVLTATPSAGAVELSWSEAAAPGSGEVAYAVSRDGGTPGGDCPSASAPAALTGCTDLGAGEGHHLYAVTAYFGGWTATSAPVEVVLSGSATKLVLAAAGSAIAGRADDLTVTVENASGATVSSYSGTHALTFAGAEASPAGNVPTVTDSSGAAVEFGSPTELEFDEGVATVSGAANGAMTLYAAETASITASDGSLATEAGLPVEVGAAAAERLAFVGVTLSAGSANPSCLFTCAIEGIGSRGTMEAAVAVTDAYGNVVTDLGRNHEVAVYASNGRLREGGLTIASTGPAESTRDFRFTLGGGRGRARSATLGAASSPLGTPNAYAEALATVER